MKDKTFKYIIFSFFVLGVYITGTAIVYAEQVDLSVTGNGSGSDNTVNATTTNNTTVSQNNQADINNNVQSDQSTGGNTTSDNNGSAGISTGSVTENSTISNTNINSNIAQGGAGSPNINGEISGNGSDSNNSINNSNNNSLAINQSNNANINNNIYGTGITGENTANDNNGNIDIRTGNISSEIEINNESINNSIFDKNCNCIVKGDVKIKISGNGSGSINEVDVDSVDSKNIFSHNDADIENNVFLDFITGRNSVIGNLGNVAIITGDIASTIKINNSKINSNEANLICENVTPPPSPTPPPGGNVTPPPPTSSGGGGGESSSSVSSSAPQVLGASALGEVLPATGGWGLFLATLLSTMLFLMGWYLRLRSGTSPPKASAF